MEELFKIKKAELSELFYLHLDPKTTPIAFENRVNSLMSGGLSKRQAIAVALTPIVMEIFYDPNAGCFAVETEAVDCFDIHNPYTGEIIEIDENDT